MAKVTAPLREEHKDLFPHVARLKAAADAVGDRSSEEVREGVGSALDFLQHFLIPHATAEDAALYPVVQKLMGAPQATATMSRDHVEVGRLTGRLSELAAATGAGEITPAQRNELRSLLYGLHALVALHFAKEEEIYLPLLDERLSPAEARAMFAAMEKAAAAARGGSR